MDLNTQWIILGEIILSMTLGGVIGLERELARKPAGLRTHMLVGGGATLLLAMGQIIDATFLQDLPIEVVKSDPIRIIQAIIVGISFLGAGTIFRRSDENYIEGLTTSASILFTAGIGIAVALRLFVLALGSTVAILITNRVLGIVENRFIQQE